MLKTTGEHNMEKRDEFSTYSPAVNIMFFAGAVIFGMFFIHPFFLGCSLLLSITYYISVRGRRAWPFISVMVLLLFAVSVINPLFNTSGETVLFSLPGGRPYTLEALFYGMAVAAMFVSIMTWFASYSAVITEDKLMYVMGRAAPALTMILSMVFRLIPEYRRRIRIIREGRRCIGRDVRRRSRKGYAENGISILSILFTWAFERGITTADSMRSRGYGEKGRIRFSLYSAERRDRLLLIFMGALMAVIIFCGLNGAARAVYVPSIEIQAADNIYFAAGISAYLVFLSIPAAINIKEEIIWRILRSGI